MEAVLSIRGLLIHSPEILNNWVLPNTITIDEVKTALLQECSELEILFPDPVTFKTVSDAWSRRKILGWQRALAAMNASYNPIHNYDRTEQITDNETNNKSITDRLTGTDTNTIHDAQELKVSAYNESTYQPKERNDRTGSNSITHGTTNTGTETGTRIFSHNAHLSGNIGVTTSQQMVESEIELSNRLNIINMIVTDFKKEFCLMVY